MFNWNLIVWHCFNNEFKSQFQTLSCDIFVSLTKIVRSEEKLICADNLSLSPTEIKVHELVTENKETIYVEFKKKLPRADLIFTSEFNSRNCFWLATHCCWIFSFRHNFHRRRMQFPLIKTSNPYYHTLFVKD